MPDIDNIENYEDRTWQVALRGDGNLKEFVLGLALLPMVHSVLTKPRSVCVSKSMHILHTYTRKEAVVSGAHFTHTLGRRPW